MNMARNERGIDSIPRFALLLRLAPVAATLLVLSALTGDPAPGDGAVGRALQQTPLGWMLANVGVALAYPVVMFLVWCTGAGLALRARNWPLVAAALLILVALGVNPVLKEILARPRPGVADLVIRRPAGGYGFPSGHTASATLMYGYAAVSLATVLAAPLRRLVAGAAGIAIALIGFERVYDGAHWPSDVAGGFTLGVLLVGGCVMAGKLIAARVSRRGPAATATADQSAGADPQAADRRGGAGPP